MTDTRRSNSPGWIGLMGRILAALGLTAALLVFLAGLRLSQASPAPTLTLRTLESVQPVSLPAPPPPVAETPPPPPEIEDLPRLDIALDSVAPPIKANPNRKLDLRLPQADFAPQVERLPQALTFAANELDSQPKLVNRPTVSFPDSLKSRGIFEGSVTLEVLISSAGNVDVRRTLDSSHVELVSMARSFASRSKFTPPKKDGRPVNALFKWPLILRP